ncbi:MAG TPA: class I SAM-dependent methyltransferase [Pirellulales bacterium]|jgi:hypothetical protein|nr:class I SAM-dependent methyltransferase [Pirellulales bacterium]
MPQTIDSRLLNRISVYQDVRWAGQTLARGRRDCNRRWELIRPLLPERGALLDVGSNFGWFGLAACETFADYVVASVEADEQSASVQRQVLQSHALRRIALLTHPAGSRLADVFARSGQRFDAVLCLSVLHWMRDHREFLTRLAPIAGRMFIEHPDPRELGAGIDRIRRQIGPIGRYLRELFPSRHAILLGRIPSDRQAGASRELWMLEAAADFRPNPTPALDVGALLELAPSWPARSWWRQELLTLQGADRHAQAIYQFTPQGLRSAAVASGGKGLTHRRLLRLAGRLPEDRLWPFTHWLYRRTRRLAGKLLRAA